MIDSHVGAFESQGEDGDVATEGGFGVKGRIPYAFEYGVAHLVEHILAHGNEIVAVVGAALTGDTDGFGALGNVDVVEIMLFKELVFQNELVHAIEVGLGIGKAVGVSGEGHSGNAHGIGFKDGADGAGIHNVLAYVKATVDA